VSVTDDQLLSVSKCVPEKQ